MRTASQNKSYHPHDQNQTKLLKNSKKTAEISSLCSLGTEPQRALSAGKAFPEKKRRSLSHLGHGASLRAEHEHRS